MSSKPGFSDEQDRIFSQVGAQQLRESDWLVGGRWLDLYVLLQVPPNVSMSRLDELIIDRLADCFYANFSRRIGSPHLNTVLEHQAEFRAILLHPEHRRRYDALLKRHREGDENAPSYEAFVREVIPPQPQAKGCGRTLMMLPVLLLNSLLKR